MLNTLEIKILQEIENKYYMQPILNLIEQDLRNNKLLQEVFNNLYG